jgi:hypothetical protein
MLRENEYNIQDKPGLKNVFFVVAIIHPEKWKENLVFQCFGKHTAPPEHNTIELNVIHKFGHPGPFKETLVVQEQHSKFIGLHKCY